MSSSIDTWTSDDLKRLIREKYVLIIGDLGIRFERVEERRRRRRLFSSSDETSLSGFGEILSFQHLSHGRRTDSFDQPSTIQWRSSHSSTGAERSESRNSFQRSLVSTNVPNLTLTLLFLRSGPRIHRRWSSEDSLLLRFAMFFFLRERFDSPRD